MSEKRENETYKEAKEIARSMMGSKTKEMAELGRAWLEHEENSDPEKMPELHRKLGEAYTAALKTFEREGK